MVTNWKLECGRQLQSRPILGKNSEVSANDTATREGRALTPTRSKIVSETDPPNHCSFAYSALASFRMGMSGSASFQRGRKSWVGGATLGGLTGEGVGATKLELGERPQWEVNSYASVVEKLLELVIAALPLCAISW